MTWAEPAYDPAGNMTTIPWPNNTNLSWSTLTADEWSNLTVDGWATMGVNPPSLLATWDAWNRLVKLVDASTNNTVAEYQYDARSRRIVKKLYDSGTLSHTRHIYLSDQNQVLEERVDLSTSAATQNIWGLMYIDGLVLRDRDTDGNGTLDERLHCLQDANWNTVALADESGTITQRFAYQPFGTCQFLDASYTSDTNTSNWTTLFTGRELDLESGLYYFRARYMHPVMGVFLARDPIGYIDGLSLYAMYFVPSGVDPGGLAWWDWIPVIGTFSCFGSGTPGSSVADYAGVPAPTCCGDPDQDAPGEAACRKGIDAIATNSFGAVIKQYTSHLAVDAIGIIIGIITGVVAGPAAGAVVGGVFGIDSIAMGICLIEKNNAIKEAADQAKARCSC